MTYPLPKVSKYKFKDHVIPFFLCILSYLFRPPHTCSNSLFFKCNPLPGYVLVLAALYKYFYFVVNPFNLYIQFLLNPQEDLIIISVAHVCFPLEEQIVLGDKQFPQNIIFIMFPALLKITLETSSQVSSNSPIL